MGSFKLWYPKSTKKENKDKEEEESKIGKHQKWKQEEWKERKKRRESGYPTGRNASNNWPRNLRVLCCRQVIRELNNLSNRTTLESLHPSGDISTRAIEDLQPIPSDGNSHVSSLKPLTTNFLRNFLIIVKIGNIKSKSLLENWRVTQNEHYTKVPSVSNTN